MEVQRLLNNLPELLKDMEEMRKSVTAHDAILPAIVDSHGGITSKLEGISDSVAGHESRLFTLETNPPRLATRVEVLETENKALAARLERMEKILHELEAPAK